MVGASFGGLERCPWDVRQFLAEMAPDLQAFNAMPKPTSLDILEIKLAIYLKVVFRSEKENKLF